MEINFYQLLEELKKSLPALLLKMLEQNKRVVIFSQSEEKIAEVDRFLWTQGKVKFLPHGTKKDGNVERHPVYLTTENENPNNADFLVVLDDVDNEFLHSFKKAFYMFEGSDEVAKKLARKKWKEYKSTGHQLNYFKKNTDGKWVRQEI